MHVHTLIQVSKDGTVKRAYALPDGQLIESVLMPYKDGRNTACLSSQAGCGMGCVFCATGQMGFVRHLSAAEIFEQASRFAGELQQKQQRLSNVVMMGMGEPLANYDNGTMCHRKHAILAPLTWCSS
jgi:23S rRNA (adenine2503-C2)-methyltransferase